MFGAQPKSKLTANSALPSGWISEISLRATTPALGLAILFFLMFASQFAQAQTYSVLYSFKDSPDGSFPTATLARNARGNLYGTTSAGGYSRRGVVFRLTPGGKQTVLYRFKAKPDAKQPTTGLVADTAGNGYGTTEAGGTYGYGTIYKLDHQTAKETVLYSFGGGSIGTGGRKPMAGLTADADNNMYGTTSVGGNINCTHGCGTVFKMDTASNVTTLYEFAGGTDGSNPVGGVVLDAAGNVYGTTELGGAYNWGTIFKLDTAGNETVLYSFTGGADGLEPNGGLVWDTAGNLYGTTGGGGDPPCTSNPTFGCGVVFQFNPTTNLLSTLHGFTGSPDGDEPAAGVVVDPMGNVYGTTPVGGSFGQGAVYEVDATGVESVVYSFSSSGAEGARPFGGLILDSAGNLYGTASAGGPYYAGVVFEIAP
jgi:uncharacterized repeat protein (TIGR03803 family)